MTFLIGLILRIGVPERLAKPLLAVVAFLTLAGLCWAAIARHDSNVIVKHDATANAQVIAKTTPANDRAADQRAADTIAITRTEQGAHDAIAKAPESAPSPAAVVLNCRRLRLAGKDTSHLAACIGH